MSVYPEKIRSRLCAPRRAGVNHDANAAGVSASFECGSFLRFGLTIDPISKIVSDVVYQTNGCGFAIVAAEVLAETVEGRALTDGLGDDFLCAAITAKLGAFDAGRRHCAALAVNAFRSALEDFRRRTITEFSGEKALICTCFGVSEETIESLVAEHLAASMDEIGARCNAGTGCGACRFLIEEMLDQNRQSE